MAKYIVAIIAIIVGLVSFGHSGDRDRYEIIHRLDPAYEAYDPGSDYEAPFRISNSFDAPSPARICLTSLVISSTNSFTVSIAAGGTTYLRLGIVAAGSYIEEWPIEDPFCMLPDSVPGGGQDIIITSSTTSPSTIQYISYQGFITAK